jgi:NADH dehydrogenase (ubiquinone) Fe-S protein 1
MYDVAPSLSRYDIVEPSSLAATGLRYVGEATKGSKSTGEALKNPIEDFYLTDVISRR